MESITDGAVVMRVKKTIEEEINEALNIIGCKGIISFLRDIIPMFELYDISDESDWVRDQVGEEDERNVRLIRTVYLMSRIAETHTSMLLNLKTRHPKLWEKIRKQVDCLPQAKEQYQPEENAKDSQLEDLALLP